MSSDSPASTRMDHHLSTTEGEYNNRPRKQRQLQRNSFISLETTKPDTRTAQHRHSMAVYMTHLPPPSDDGSQSSGMSSSSSNSSTSSGNSSHEPLPEPIRYR